MPVQRATITLKAGEDRQRAIRWVAGVPDGTRIEFKAPRRSLPQNDMMWALLTEISNKTDWHGRKLTPTEWKCVFTSGLKKATVVPDLEGTGFVMLGISTSDMSKDEMSDMIELIHKFAAERGISLEG